MHQLRLLRRLSIISCLVTLFLYWLLETRYNIKTLLLVSFLSTTPLRLQDRLVKNLLSRNHVFIPANEEYFNFGGRWLSTSKRTRWDAGYSGAYVDFTVTNTAALYLALHNTCSGVTDQSAETQSVDGKRMVWMPIEEKSQPVPPISLIVEINGRTSLHFAGSACGILELYRDLNTSKEYDIRITHAGSAERKEGICEFEGIWIDTGGHIQPSSSVTTTTEVSTAEIRTNLNQQPILNPREKLHQRKVIEVITTNARGKQTDVLHAWPRQLSSKFGIDHSIIPISNHCLTTICLSKYTIHDLYFRSGPPSTPFFQRPWYPAHTNDRMIAALILNIGLNDFSQFFSDLTHVSKPHAQAEFTTKFIKSYVKLVETIRATHFAQSNSEQISISNRMSNAYLYNSAPSTLPIFLVGPFTTSTKLNRILSNSLILIVQELNRQGDKATCWIDTSGWLDPRYDFEREATRPTNLKSVGNLAVNGDRSSSESSNDLQRVDQQTLTPSAHAKIARYMALHLCPFLSDDGSLGNPWMMSHSSSSTQDIPDGKVANNTSITTANVDSMGMKQQTKTKHRPMKEGCPFDRHAYRPYHGVGGSVHTHEEAMMEKIMEERKIELIQSLLGY